MPTCIVCGQPFEASKKNAKTCGDVCRKRLSRRRGEIGRLGAAAVYNLRMLNKYGHDWPDLERQCRGQLERIKLAAIEKVLEALGNGCYCEGILLAG